MQSEAGVPRRTEAGVDRAGVVLIQPAKKSCSLACIITRQAVILRVHRSQRHRHHGSRQRLQARRCRDSCNKFFLAVTPCLQRLKHSDGLVVAEELFTGGQPRLGDIVSFEVEPRKDASDRKSDCVCVL